MRLVVLLLVVFATSLAALAQQRFDFKVREDMFAGMDGDTEAFDRAMKLIADTLAKDPDHAEAWSGAAMAGCSWPARLSNAATLPPAGSSTARA